MSENPEHENRSLWKLVTSSGVLASMCCLPSVLLAGLGLMSLSAADGLSKELYFGPARWILYGLSVILVIIGLKMHFNKQGICTLDEAKRQRKYVINISLLVATASIVFYMIWNHVILKILGIAIGLPWEEDAFWN